MAVPKTWKPIDSHYRPPRPIPAGPIMRSADRLGRQARISFLHQAYHSVRPDHAAFHMTRNSLGAHNF